MTTIKTFPPLNRNLTKNFYNLFKCNKIKNAQIRNTTVKEQTAITKLKSENWFYKRLRDYPLTIY